MMTLNLSSNSEVQMFIFGIFPKKKSCTIFLPPMSAFGIFEATMSH